MNKYLIEAQQIFDELVENRRYLHRNAEIKDDLPVTAAFVQKMLDQFGIPNYEISKCGIVGIIGGSKQGKVVMLRADMDALDLTEESGLPFKSETAYAHCCGHDLHTAMLLGAAKILKKHEQELNGTIKLMFQPGEEFFIGAKAMIDAGVLENPKVDIAIDMHMNGRIPLGNVAICKGYTCASCDGFKLTVIGKDCHGAWPHTGIDPINAAAHIYFATQELIARESPGDKTVTLTFGQFSGGNTANIIPGEVIMQGTLRCFDPDVRKKLIHRLHTIIDNLGKAFEVSVQYEVLSDVPALYTTPELQEEITGYCHELGLKFIEYIPSSASDDFARITEKVPSVFFSLGCKPYGDGPVYPPHNPKIIFNEDALPFGVAIHVQSAIEYLNNHR